MSKIHPPTPLDRIYDFELLRRFVGKIEVNPVTGCWLWTGSVDKIGGYPRLWYDGKNQRAHRLSYAMFVGPIPEELTVDHLCHCTNCVNPAHFDLKTVGENTMEMHDRQRNTPASQLVF